MGFPIEGIFPENPKFNKQKICSREGCNKPFRAFPPNKLYCSPDCGNAVKLGKAERKK